ncbi:penicillin-binding transpeptidase domain-containing protein [Paenibacillus sp. XY044]|uniref:penicillin-binding protein PBP4(5) n=1 Tax=Paenibacillus sp. XY044 TaxID=2026089 RepID=UPI0015C6719B|nr:penicillin-binding transpeptidase domain-containing protein [Paenibacillus sp. XY044]
MKRKQFFTYVLLSFLVASGLAIYVFFQGRDDSGPDQTLQSYFSSLKELKFDRLYDLMSPESLEQSGMSREQFVQKYQSIFSGMGVTGVKVTPGPAFQSEEDEQYSLNYSATWHTQIGDVDGDYHMKLVQVQQDHDKVWAIEWNPSLILPEMSTGDKVRVRVLTPQRGEITDRDGNPLATRGTVYEWGITPSGLGDNPDQTISNIAAYFKIPVEYIQKKLAQKWVKPEYFVPMANVPDSDLSLELPGVSIKSKEVRYYPLGQAAAHLTGYVRQVTQEDLEIDKDGYYAAGDWIGKAGLEQSLEKQLRGQKGGLIEITDAKGNRKSIVAEKPAVNGQSVRLTIASDLQQNLYRTLSGDAGAAVMMNPKHGDLLALVSTPSYDPNLMVTGLSQEKWDAYSNDPDLPFFNRFAARYAPGSVFKAVTAAAGLTEGITQADKTRRIDGLHWKKDAGWGGYYVTRVKDVSTVNMVDALVYSDNIYFAQEALEMGSGKFIEGISKFGFGENWGLDMINLKPSQYANSSHKDLASEVLLADTSYGQGEMLMSPIHVAAAFTPFAQQGQLVPPILFPAEEDQETPPAIQIITPQVAGTVKDALMQVVSRSGGTAHALSTAKLKLAAKTGTAELKAKKGEQGEENGFVVAFDADPSSFLLSAVIENVHSRGGSHYVINKLKPFLKTLNMQTK